MSLPADILRSRLKNEIAACSRYLRHPIEVSDENLRGFPIELEIRLVRVPALMLENGKVMKRSDHRFSAILNEEYPFEKPLVIWKTPIFHPNIMMPEDGGHVCIKLLKDWNFNSTLLSFINGIEYLLQNPNPSSPFGTESCTFASEYFNNNPGHSPPVVCSPLPKVVRGD